MKIDRVFRIALNIILHSKLRSWLTIIGIVIGVASIIAIISIGTGYEVYINEQIGDLGSDIIYVIPGFDKASSNHAFGQQAPSSSINPLTEKEIQVIRSIPEVEIVSKGISGTEDVYYLGSIASLSIEGVDVQSWKHLTSLDIDKGRLLGPGDNNAVVIGGSIADGMYDDPLDINRKLKIGNKSFSVVGIAEKEGDFGAGDRVIYMPFDSAREVLEKEMNEYDSISIKVKDLDFVDAVEEKIEEKLMIVRHVREDEKDFTVISMKSVQETINAILQGFTAFLGAIAAISLLVGAVGITNTMFTSVLERTKEIGVMKALGAQNKDIMMIYLFNSGLVGLVGGILGVLFGILVSVGITAAGFKLGAAQDGLKTIITPGLIIFSLVFSMFIGMIAGIIPAYRASKLKPVDALRYE